MLRFSIGLLVFVTVEPAGAARAHTSSGRAGLEIAVLSRIARIHGKIVHVDRVRGTFTIHHDPFSAMPMAMTMEVEPKHRSDLRALHAGEIVDVTVDTRIYPWPGTDIRPAHRRVVR